MALASMTGSGSGSAPLGGGRVVVEIRTVNARGLDVRVRAAEPLEAAAPAAEARVRERLRRGRVDVALRAEGSLGAPPVLDVARAAAALEGLASLRDRVAPGAEVPLSLLSLVPGLFVPAEGATERMQEAVLGAIDAALGRVSAARAAEGAATARDLAARLAALRGALERVGSLAAELPARAEARLRQRLATLTAGVAVDEVRLATEVALLADRCDVHEELTRLDSHLTAFGEVLHAEAPEGAGRRLDFLLQEIQREVSTLGAKAQDGEVARQVVAMKVEIERMREQVQNVE